MARIIKTGSLPDFSSSDFTDYQVLTPHKAAAKTIGVRAHSLEKEARRIVIDNGFRIAPPMIALGTLKSAVRDVFGVQDSAPVVSRVSQILKTILRVGIDHTKLQCYGEKEEVKKLGAIAAEYVRRLRAQKMIDREETLRFAASLNPRKRRILVYGYFRGRVEESEFIDAVADDGSVICIPVHENHIFKINHERVSWLEDRGWIADRETSSRSDTGTAAASRFLKNDESIDLSAMRAFSYSDIETEIRATLADVKALISDGTSARDIVIMCRSAKNYGPVLVPVAEEYGIRIDMTFSVPILETNFGGYLQLLLNTFQEFGFENVLRVFMHPFGLGLTDEMLENAYKFHPRTPEDWMKTGVFTKVLVSPERSTRVEWNNYLRKIFETYDVKTSLAIRTREILAFERFNESLDEFCYEPGEELTRDQWISEVREIMTSVNVPFNPSRGGVAFHDPDTIIGGRFKHLFIIGASEGTLPAGVSENPVVDFFERKQLAAKGVHFEVASDVPRWEAMSFYFSLLTASDSITMSYPQNINVDARFESSFFGQLGLELRQRTVAVEAISSVKELRRFELRRDTDSDDLVLQHARRAFEIESSRESSEPQDEFDGNVGIKFDKPDHKWSVSQLTTIGQCGFRWFAGKLLRLEPIEEMEGELTPSTRGSLYHKVLELAVEKAGDCEDVRAGMLSVLEESFLEAEKDPEIGLPFLDNWEKERKEHLKIIRKAVEAPDFIRSDAKIVGTEVEFNSEWEGFKMRGYIDRLDRTPDGIIAIDYKTSSSPPKGAKDSSGAAKLDIQLPLYLKSAVPSLESISGGSEGIAGYYYSLTKGEILKEADLEQEEELTLFAQRVRGMLSDGNYSVDPDKQRYACRYCDFESVCRYGNRIKRKAEVNQDEANA